MELKSIVKSLGLYIQAKYRFQYYSRQDIARYQEQQIASLLKYVNSKTPFYADLYRNLNFQDLKSFSQYPIINKKIFMEHLGDVNSIGLSKQEIMDFVLENEKNRDFDRKLNGYTIGMSSGTSGNKGIEMYSAAEENIFRTFFFARFPYNFLLGKRVKLAFILRVSSAAFKLDILGHKLFYIDPLQPINKVIELLNELQPNIVSGPPSYLFLLREEQQKGNLKIKPQIMISYAEVLDDFIKREIEKTFKCKVVEIYKCTEGAIAMPCKFGSLHINEDILYVETLNEDGTVCAEGETCSRLLITDLVKRTLPIIRYELNDIVTLDAEKCKCGSNFRVITRIQGRKDDMLIGQKADGGIEYIMPDFLSRGIISISDDIIDYQVFQDACNKLRIILKLKENTAPKVIEQKCERVIEKIFAKFDCSKPDIEFIIGELIPNPNSGKLIRIHRNFTF